MPQYTQEGRLIRVDTALGEDVLLLESFEGSEIVSSPFHFRLGLLSEDPAIAPDDVLRTPVLLRMALPEGEERVVHGIVNRFIQLDRHDELTFYEASVVPTLWFLSLFQNCRIFQEKSVLEIVEEVFKARGLSDFEIRCTRNYPAREFCVQYRESDLNFISRLLEEEGIFYFFEHTPESHLLVLADNNSSVVPCPGQPSARLTSRTAPEEDVVTHFRREHSVHVGTVTLRDYDHLQPSLQLEATISGNGHEEVYDYHPGDFTELEEGERYARIRLEEAEVSRHVVRGAGTCRAFTGGTRFDLEGHYRSDANTSYMLVEVHHEGRAGDYRSWGTAPLDYRNDFLAIPHDVPYRPPPRAEKPVVRGSQTALVVGKPGEEVWVDKLGCIKIQFNWDRDGKKDEHSSCWVRVATPWGGKGYGGVSLPRIGNEVIVDFLEGDPDCPIVTGSVYNGEQTPPFDLPGAGIQMGMKSRSSPGGGGNNEFSMTDTKGKEQVTVHAQYDMSTTVGNDETHSVTNNRTADVGVDETMSVGSNQTVEVGADRDVSIAANDSLSVGADRSATVGGSDSVDVGADRSLSAGSNVSMSSGADTSVDAGANLTMSAGADASLDAGANASVGAGAEISITAGASITLSAGGSSIEIGPGGVTINTGGVVTLTGSMVKNNC